MNTSKPFLSIAIIGAGYAGIALAAQLNRSSSSPLHLYLVEAGAAPLGLAYSTTNPLHLLNVPTQKMSAFAELPDHFLNWVQDRKPERQDLGKQFMPRVLYGQYLQSLLQEVLEYPAPKVSAFYQQAEVIGVIPSTNNVVLQLRDGSTLTVDKVVLAIGNTLPAPQSLPAPQVLANPWDYAAIHRIAKTDPVLIIGTGLTMVDTVISLLDAGHQAPIYAVSRRGLVPQAHHFGSLPSPLDIDLLPRRLNALVKTLRIQAAALIEQGQDWRSLMEALRPHTAKLWQRLSLIDKKRFLRLLQPYWDTHRHRIAPEVAAMLEQARASGQLKILAGRVQDTTPEAMKIKPRFAKETMELNTKWVINCSGFNPDYQKGSNPLIKQVLESGIAQTDPTGLGFLVNDQGALLNKQGEASQQVYSLGTPCRGVYWECIAVPDIRLQVAQLALRLLQD